MTTLTGADAAGLVVAVAARMRRAALDVPMASVLLATRALEAVGVEDRGRARASLRACLVHRPEDGPVFDQIIAGVLGGPAPILESEPLEVTSRVTLALDADDEPPTGDSDTVGGEDDELTLRYSRVEVLRHADLADLAADELDEALALIDRLAVVTATRPARRHAPASAPAHAVDLRRTLRRALATAGEPLVLAHRRSTRRPRRLVLLLDVSGSMRPYARGLLRFAHSAMVGRGAVEAFALATRLTRLTRELDSHDPQEALDRASAAIVDFASGTRLGECLGEFCDMWGVPGMARGAVVVVLSDGWDRGDPERLGEELARLRRVAHRLVWVNPLKAAPGYAPIAQGMAAALPHVDEFVEGHSVDSLARLAELLRA